MIPSSPVGGTDQGDCSFLCWDPWSQHPAEQHRSRLYGEGGDGGSVHEFIGEHSLFRFTQIYMHQKFCKTHGHSEQTACMCMHEGIAKQSFPMHAVLPCRRVWEAWQFCVNGYTLKKFQGAEFKDHEENLSNFVQRLLLKSPEYTGQPLPYPLI